MGNFNKIIKELEEYAEYEGTELGDCVQLLINLWNCNYLLSPDFNDTLYKEIKDIHCHLKNNFEWKETTKTYTREIKELVPRFSR